MKTLIKAFDEKNPYNNVVVPLSLAFDEVFFIYHNQPDQRRLQACKEVLKKQRKMKIHFRQLIDDDAEIDALLAKYPEMVIDLSTSRYLSIVMLEKVLAQANQIVYYDDEELVIKSYREHRELTRDIYKLNIKDLLYLHGGKLNENLHKPIIGKDTIETVFRVVESCADEYSAFLSFVSRINNLLSHYKEQDGTYDLDAKLAKQIKSDEGYRRFASLGLFKIEGERLIFANKELRELFKVSGSFLENYIYHKLIGTHYFDEVLMSVVIDFSGYERRYPIVCELDCIALKDNHLLFTSCKSNKVDSLDLCEIKVHNQMFGNNLSHPVVCTIDDLDVKSPAIYAKAKQLEVAVIDRTAFKQDRLAEYFAAIVDGTYRYESAAD